jgi:hypothetical protein
MKSLRTYKLKIISGADRFYDVSVNYRDACNWLSQIVFKMRSNCFFNGKLLKNEPPSTGLK